MSERFTECRYVLQRTALRFSALCGEFFLCSSQDAYPIRSGQQSRIYKPTELDHNGERFFVVAIVGISRFLAGRMRILALEAYYGGSHQAFLDGWVARSGHAFTVLGLPAYKWKWRMRHAGVTFAEMVTERVRNGEEWDAVFCCDMLNLAEFHGLAPAVVARLPSVVYFHENQLTYPNQQTAERDLHFAYTNLTTALAADAVWFNSAYHRDSFLTAAETFLNRMPDYRHTEMVDAIRDKTEIHPPGITAYPSRGSRVEGPLRILWAARWEHDKNPADFFTALEVLDRAGVDFRLSVIGEAFDQIPDDFPEAEQRFGEKIIRWGYQASRAEYEAALLEADVVVSTALHEFFGIGMLEAVAAGAYPVVPERLAYPETLGALEGVREDFFYDGSVAGLAKLLSELAQRCNDGVLWGDDPQRGRRVVERFLWERMVGEMDAAIESLVHAS